MQLVIALYQIANYSSVRLQEKEEQCGSHFSTLEQAFLGFLDYSHNICAAASFAQEIAAE